MNWVYVECSLNCILHTYICTCWIITRCALHVYIFWNWIVECECVVYMMTDCLNAHHICIHVESSPDVPFMCTINSFEFLWTTQIISWLNLYTAMHYWLHTTVEKCSWSIWLLKLWIWRYVKSWKLCVHRLWNFMTHTTINKHY